MIPILIDTSSHSHCPLSTVHTNFRGRARSDLISPIACVVSSKQARFATSACNCCLLLLLLLLLLRPVPGLITSSSSFPRGELSYCACQMTGHPAYGIFLPFFAFFSLTGSDSWVRA
ncbi:hypothetical protein QBC41DRAFT_105078 [Cercophora samala]|uniref:Uncharacterized protein n=1 Tax=Cercophora samala TaxID=330535 RepID=A0AA39ZMR4_9PEZI|nr:hypothetical protein QBC41DRAFT_105078 [Cercophora samala]